MTYTNEADTDTDRTQGPLALVVILMIMSGPLAALARLIFPG